MAKRDACAYDADGNEYSVVDLFYPEPHPDAPNSVGGQQGSLWKHLFKVLADDARLNDRNTIVHQCRHDLIRVELHVFGLLRLAGTQIEMDPLPWQPLLGHRHP